MALQPIEPTVLLSHFPKCFPIPSSKEELIFPLGVGE